MIGGAAGMVMETPGQQFSEGVVRIPLNTMTERFSLSDDGTGCSQVCIYLILLYNTHYILLICYMQL